MGILALILLLVAAWVFFRRRPANPEPGLPPSQALVQELARDVNGLCAIGMRNTVVPESLAASAAWITRELTAAGYQVERHAFVAERDAITVENLIVERRGNDLPGEIVLIGGHYDTLEGTPGADDNASGVAATLALARRFAKVQPRRTLRFVAFVNEEPPHFQTPDMGSWQYAKRCRDRGERIVAMLSLETIGYYDSRRGSQQYPAPLSAFYPDRGDFIAFASNVSSRGLTSRCVRAFRKASAVPVESASLPEAVPGIGWSDQWSFWQFGYPAVMVTDTAPYRNPHYHAASDRPETLNYQRLAQVVEGLGAVVEELVE